MRIALIGSRGLSVQNMEQYIPENITEVITGGAKGIDACAEAYAKDHGLKLTLFLPNYEKFGKAAPLHRNLQIIEHADMVIAFWDGASKGTKFVIDQCGKCGKKLIVHRLVR